MKHQWILIALLGCITLQAKAEIYRCTVNGTVLFSDSKCASNAQKVEIVPEQPDLENADVLKRQSDQINQSIGAGLKSEARGNVHDRKIAALELESADLRQQMETELAPLRKRREQIGRNNANRRNLDAIMATITERYEARIKDNQELIDSLRERQ